VSQSNADYQSLDTLIFHVNFLKMPTGIGKTADSSEVRHVSVMAYLMRGIVQTNPAVKCQAHILVISVAKVANTKSQNGRKKMLPIFDVIFGSGMRQHFVRLS
jgi:hypothetical protein